MWYKMVIKIYRKILISMLLFWIAVLMQMSIKQGNMRMKRRDVAAALMAVLMAGSIFAGCGSSNKNVNQDVNQNIESTQDTQLTTKAVADNETKAADAKNEKESESTTQEADTEADENSADTGSETPESENGNSMQEAGNQNDTASEENAWDGGNSEDSDQGAGTGQESVENNNQNSNQNNNGNNAPGESQAPASGGNVNIKDDNSLLANAKVNTVTYSAYASEVLRIVNIERDKVGAAHLVLDGALCDAANMRAIEMDYSGNFSHTRPNGSDCFTVFSFCNISFNTCGENIAAGYVTPADVVDGWMHSEGHKANILKASYTKMGLGYSTGGGGEYGRYWAQEFAG